MIVPGTLNKTYPILPGAKYSANGNWSSFFVAYNQFIISGKKTAR